jgi:hypothetical protein
MGCYWQFSYRSRAPSLRIPLPNHGFGMGWVPPAMTMRMQQPFTGDAQKKQSEHLRPVYQRWHPFFFGRMFFRICRWHVGGPCIVFFFAKGSDPGWKQQTGWTLAVGILAISKSREFFRGPIQSYSPQISYGTQQGPCPIVFQESTWYNWNPLRGCISFEISWDQNHHCAIPALWKTAGSSQDLPRGIRWRQGVIIWGFPWMVDPHNGLFLMEKNDYLRVYPHLWTPPYSIL